MHTWARELCVSGLLSVQCAAVGEERQQSGCAGVERLACLEGGVFEHPNCFDCVASVAAPVHEVQNAVFDVLNSQLYACTAKTPKSPQFVASDKVGPRFLRTRAAFLFSLLCLAKTASLNCGGRKPHQCQPHNTTLGLFVDALLLFERKSERSRQSMALHAACMITHARGKAETAQRHKHEAFPPHALRVGCGSPKTFAA